MENNLSRQSSENMQGKGKATASLVLGIVSLAISNAPIFNVPPAIIGLVLALMSKKEGYVGGMRKAGFVCSLIALIIGAITTITFLVSGAPFSSIFDYLLNIFRWEVNYYPR
jgi:hypothetical protein